MPKASPYMCQDLIEKKHFHKYCLVCGKSFNRKYELERHRKIHTGIKEHSCDYPTCTKSFYQKSQLSNHKNTHTGHAPHWCDICLEKFKDPSACSRHRKEQHEGNYVCFVEGCSKKIARKCNFRKHLQGHQTYSAGMKLEDHWVCRELPHPKRKEGTSRPSQKSVVAKVEKSTEISLKLQTHEECYKSIAVPELHSIDAAYIESNMPLAHALPAAEQSFELHVHPNETTLWPEVQEWQNVIDAQNMECHSSLSFPPPSLSSMSPSAGSSYLPLHQGYPGSIEFHPQSLFQSVPIPGTVFFSIILANGTAAL